MQNGRVSSRSQQMVLRGALSWWNIYLLLGGAVKRVISDSVLKIDFHTLREKGFEFEYTSDGGESFHICTFIWWEINDIHTSYWRLVGQKLWKIIN